MELKPVLKGSRETGPGVGGGPGVPGEPSMELLVVVPLLGSRLLLPGLFWFLSFSSPASAFFLSTSRRIRAVSARISSNERCSPTHCPLALSLSPFDIIGNLKHKDVIYATRNLNASFTKVPVI